MWYKHVLEAFFFEPLYEVVCCGDGHFQCVIYSLGPYIVEQLMLSYVVKHWCPKCIAVHTDLDSGGIYCHCEHTDFLIDELHMDILWDEYGLIGNLPFTNDFPQADIHELLSFDLLHQLIKGAFKDHLVDWVTKYLKAVHGTKWSEEIMSDIDCRVAAVASFSGLQQFPQGHDFKQWTGNDSKVLMKVFLLVIGGHVPQDMVHTFCALLEFCYLVWCNIITRDTLNKIQDALYCFHHYCKIFDHIKVVKEPWQWSSRHNALDQMLVTNQCLDKPIASCMDFDVALAALSKSVNLNPDDAHNPEDIPATSLPWHPGKLHVFNSAAVMFYTPSDPNAEGMRGLKVVRVICFFSFNHNWDMYPCTLIHWFEKISDDPDENTGMWMVTPSFHKDGSKNIVVIHIEMFFFHAAHLIPIYGSKYIPHTLKFYHSLDTFHSFYVNKYADYHAFKIVF
ncbi:uncharacterized protein BJ212DRAFT_1448010 [Suillus subaureus]|uniref:CxC2-like cysteine cluster KDZ transposase-associated domain-containing protein n=1 Tax=Suillus subaureus TaxID=48587 RepID=A0A9P7JBW1_9AGAM|nr:uncharacterized protein BJ212DRAFT_1448010 [Suillus subaureus]KAG1813371.1 hypothetical protein BJ212DRAFT_1448010 [Suillus subaureus]